jgi:hypothetical protein
MDNARCKAQGGALARPMYAPAQHSAPALLDLWESQQVCLQPAGQLQHPPAQPSQPCEDAPQIQAGMCQALPHTWNPGLAGPAQLLLTLPCQKWPWHHDATSRPEAPTN